MQNDDCRIIFAQLYYQEGRVAMVMRIIGKAGHIVDKGRELLYGRQKTILSAATIIMLMVAASRILGLIRNRVFVHFFAPEELDTYLAAFQLPDLIFEVLILGTMSAAFIPVFTNTLTKNKKDAWLLAGTMLNIMLIFFAVLAVLIFIFAHPIYSFIASGFSQEQINQVVSFSRILLIAQLFFIASYVFSAVLESNERFLVPAIAPLFYNLGIIVATVFAAPTFHLYAPVFGAVVGSLLHIAIQTPVVLKLGFRPVFAINLKSPLVKKIAKLALPRVLELSAMQVKRLVDLSLASLIAGGLTYFKFADSLSVFPVGIFGLSIAKASLPQLSVQVSNGNIENFKRIFAESLKQIMFLIIPVSVFFAVLRIPLVRLAFGGAQFDWRDTVQTGYVLSAFVLGIASFAITLLVSRAFYALHDTATPVKVSFITILVNIALAFLFIKAWNLPIWSLALSYSLGGIIQMAILIGLLARKTRGLAGFGVATTAAKTILASLLSGSVMYFFLKILDRTVWDKKLSFLGNLGLALPTTFDKFVIDTRYTTNLIILTLLVAVLGVAVYIACAWLLKIQELQILLQAVKQAKTAKITTGKPTAEAEGVVPAHTNDGG